MVSKNNRIERIEQAAERQSHFGIRKLTIGAASVLLGTSLWLGNNANVAKADTNADKGDIDKANQETANPVQSGVADAKKAVVVANSNSAKDKATTDANAVSDSAAKAALDNSQKVEVQSDNSTNKSADTEKKAEAVAKTATNEVAQNSAANTNKAENSQATAQTTEKANANDVAASQQKAAQTQVKNGVANTENQKQKQTAEQTKAADAVAKIDKAAQDGQNAKKNDSQKLDITKAALSGVQDLKKDKAVNNLNTSTVAKLQKAAGDKADEQVTLKSNNVDKATAEKLAKLYGTSLVQTNDATGEKSDTPSKNDIWTAIGNGLKNAGKSLLDPEVISKVPTLVDDLIKHPNSKKTLDDGVALLGTAGFKALQNVLNGNKSDDSGDQQESKDGFKDVSSWSELQAAASDSNTKGARLTQDITAGIGNLSVNHEFTIESAPSEVSAQDAQNDNRHTINLLSDTIIPGLANLTIKNINLTGNNANGLIQPAMGGTVTVDNVKASGSSLYNGNGNLVVKGNVETDFTDGQSISDDEFQKEMDTKNRQGVGKNWYAANIVANNVTVDKNATLTVNRTQNGHGIVLTGGNGSFGQGTLKVDENANLNITLKNGTATNEVNRDPENANTAVWAAHNGNFTTGTGANVTINAGHGRGIVFDEPFGGTTNHQVATPSSWYRNRFDVGQQSKGGNNNSFKLGDFTKLTMLSRDGILLGNGAKMDTGEHSTVLLNNYGNGVGLEGDAQANIVIGPHTYFNMQSDGKDHSGIWNAGNYIGLGENAQFTVAHDATFKFNLKNAWRSGSLNYADNFNIVSVKKGSNPTVNIENNAIFDGESDYRNIFGEILSFSYNAAPARSTVNINGAKYVNFQRHGATTPGGWQNVVSYDKQHKHSGNLFYSWPANTWNVNGNTYNVYKWHDETESQNGFKDNSKAEIDTNAYQNLVDSIKSLNAQSDDYWTGVKNLTLGVNMHRSNLQNISPNGAIGVKKGWSADDKSGYGFDTEFSQRLALVATKIPTEDDKVTDNDGDYNVIVKVNKELKPGQVVVAQEGKKGRTITIDRTYYTVDLSDPNNPKKIIDTSKGNNGKETKVIKLGDAQDEIIYIGPETATINYVDKNGKAINGTDKKPIIGTVTASPVQTSDDDQVIFDENGNVTAANVDYNESPDLQKAIDAGYIKTPGQDKDAGGTPVNWEYALAQGTNKYNVTGLTKDAIIKAVENKAGSTANIAPAGPVYKVILEKPQKQNVNVTVNYVDDDNNGSLITIGNKTYTDNLNGKPGDPMNYSTQPDIQTIEGTGKYRMVKDEFTPGNFPDKAATYKVHFVHVITPVGPDNPDPHGNDNLKKTDLQKTGTKQIHYVLDDGLTTDKSQMTPMVYYNPDITDITRKVIYNGTGYVDAVTGKLVNAKKDDKGNWIKDGDGQGKITWAPATNADKTYDGAKTKVANGYVADRASVENETVPTNTDGTPKDGTTEYVVYKQMGKIVPIDKKTGKTITGQPQPQYKNDPNDPTKALPTNPVNDIPGYKISNPQTDPNVDPTKKQVTTPDDPTKDTKVEYDQNVKDQNAALKLYDDTAKKWITITGADSTADANIVTASGKPSTDIDFISGHTSLLPDVVKLMNKGYAYVSTTKGTDPVKTDGYVMLDPMTIQNAIVTQDPSGINAAFGPYDTDDNTTQTFVIHLKHTYTPVNPSNPGTPNNPLNPGDPDGPKYPDGTSKVDLIKNVHRTINYTVNGDKDGSLTPKPINGDVTFTGSGYLDNVTGEWVNVDPKTAEISGPSEGLSWSYVAKKDGAKKEGTGKNYSFSSVAYHPIKGYYVSSITSKFENGKAPDFSDGNGGVKKYDVDASKDLNDLTVNIIYDKIPEDKGLLSVVFHDDTTDTDITKANGKDIGFHTGDNDSRLVKAGTEFNYTPDNDQKTLEDEGYVYVTTDGTFPADHKVPKGETIVTIHMKHGVVPVGPDKPGPQSGHPINPNDKNPMSPKYPDGVDAKNLTKDVTRKITYQVLDENGKVVKDSPVKKDLQDQTQKVTFEGRGYLDKVTGAWVTVDPKDPNTITGSSSGITWTTKDNNNKFAEIAAPNVDGYHVVADDTSAKNGNFDDVTKENVNSETGEVLEVNGVTKDASNVQVTITLAPDEKAPTEVAGKVSYIDDDATDPNNKVLKTDPLKGNVGDPIKYDPTTTITNFENKGYKLVSNNVPTDGTFNSDPDKNNFEVHLKHDIEPIDPSNPTPKPGGKINPKDPDPNSPKYPNDPKNPVDADKLTQSVKRTIHYVVQDENGNLTGKTVADPVDETVEFEGKGYIDKVTGKWVNEDGSALKDGQTPITWTVKGDDTFAGHKSSSYAGYHLIGVRDVKDNKVGAKNTVDSDNDQDIKEIKASRDTAQPYDVYVVYEANGKVVPVDKDGNPIPDAPTPKYGTDDNDPKKVTPTDTPTIPGYKISPDQNIPNRPKDTNPSGDVDPNTKKVTPTDPGKDTPVVYEKVEPAKDKGILNVVFRDQDKNNDIIQSVGQINGKEQDVGSDPSYTAENEKADQDKLVNEGYVYVSTDGKIPDKIAKGTTTVTIYMKHGTKPVDPKNPGDPEKPNKPGEPQHPTDYKPSDLTETITRTIKYVGLPEDKAQKDVQQNVTFEKKGVYDTVTGKWITPLAWTEKSQTIENVTSPTVDGYHVIKVDKDSRDQKNVDSKELTPDDKSYTVTVTYAKKNVPTPEVKKGSVTVKVHDQTTGEDLDNYGYKTGEQEEGYTVDYKDHDAQITDLKNHGYEIVSDPVADGDVPKTVPDTALTFTINVKHKIQPVTPDNPPKSPVDPENPDGPKYPTTYKETDLKKSVTRTVEYVDDSGKQVVDPFKKTVNFTGTRFFDEVTGEWTNMDGVKDKDQNNPTTIWSSDQTLQGQKSPVVKGYYLVGVKKDTEKHNDSKDGLNVDDITVDHNASDYTVQVVYNPLKNIIPVDKDGNPIPGVKTPQYTNDPTDPTKPGEDESIPPVPGYHIDPNQPNPGVDPKNNVVNPVDPGKDTPVHFIKDNTPVVDQTSSLKIIDQDRNNAVLKNYYGEGKPDTKISFKGYTSSVIQDYLNKGYELVGAKDDNGSTKDAKLEGIDPTKWSFGTYDNDKNVSQDFTITLKHGKQPVNPNNPGKPGEPINPNDPNGPKYPDGSDTVKQTYTRTITYTGAGEKTPGTVTQTVNFEGNGILDKVTGEWILPDGSKTKDINKGMTWSDDQTLSAIPTKIINGYHIVSVSADSKDGINVDAKTISHQNGKSTVTVTYSPNGKIIPVDPSGKPIPNAPTPQYPTNPENPKNVIPNEPIPDIPGYHPVDPTPVTPTDPGKDTPVVYVPDKKDVTTVVHYIDKDANNAVIRTSNNLTGKEGTQINYRSTNDLKSLTDEGYVLITNGYDPDGKAPNFDPKVPVYKIILGHGTTPVNPNNPGKPGEPINPNDPNGPKYPDGSDKVTRNVTRTIHYVDNNKQELKGYTPVVQTVKFTGSGVLDNVTGQWKTPFTWKVDGTKDFAGVNSPVVEGYHLVGVDRDSHDNVNVDLATPSQDTNNYDVYVTYVQNGKIIPVDPTGNPIPNVPTPTYPTDPKDPTKVVPNEPVPDVPGKTPTKPTVTPTDPGKDTPVVYTEAQNAQVIYRDVNDPNKVVQLGDPDKLSGNPGDKIVDNDVNTRIADLEKKGYVLSNNGFPTDASFDNDPKTTQTFYVDFKHGTVPVTPDNPGKPGQPINPGDPNGPKWPDNTGKDNLTKTGTQTIHYTGAGENTPKDNVQSFTFTKNMVVDKVTGKVITDGSWNVTSHTFGSVDTPVVDGYHADKRTAGGQTITPTDLKKEVTVNYTKNGKIVPVDPSGKPIPNVPTPTYPTDPNDPTKVVPDEPVPTVPGKTPKTPTVTPTDPGKDTPVVYEDQQAVVNYVDQDDNNKVITSSGNLTGASGEKINYSTAPTIKDLENKGYVLVHDGFPADATYDNDSKTTQTYTVVMKHGTTTITPDKPGKPGQPINPNDPNGPKWPDNTGKDNLTKTGTQTIHYTGAGENTPKDNVQSFTFTKKMVVDNVTGKVITDGSWNVTSHTFGSVDTPVVDGYHADKRAAGGQTITPTDLKKEVTVSYTKNGKIVPVDPSGKPIPNVPTPTYPTDPTDPTKVVPDEPVPTVPGMTPKTPTVTPTNPGKDTPVPYNPVVNDKGEVNVFVHDNTTGTNIDEYGYNSGTEDVGSKVTYDKNKVITDLTNKGYKVVNPDVTIPSEVAKGTTNVTIYVEHDVVPVNPTNPGKPGQPINPNDPNGPKYPEGTNDTDLTHKVTRIINFVDGNGKVLRAPITQTITFTANGELDKVTGKWTKPLTWSPDQKVNGMDVPFVDGYHVVNISKDGNGLKGITSVTLSHNDKDYSVNVVYGENGHIIPVDPEGNPIPDAPQPQFPTDPADPSKTIPGTKPSVPGYEPQTGKPGDPVDPDNNPGDNVKVPYVKNPQAVVATGSVTYIDKTTGQTLKVDNLKGNVGDKITYTTAGTITEFENKGYKLVENTFKDGQETFTKDGNKFTVTLEHALAPVGPNNPHEPGTPINPNDPNGPKWPAKDNYSKDYTSTIHFVDDQGKQLKPDETQTSTWTRTLIIDKVTGKVTNPDEAWKPNIDNYKSTTVPVIDGYVADTKSKNGNPVGKTIAGGKVVEKNIEDSVVYHKIGKIVPVDPSGNPIPGAEQPQYKNDPTDPTKVTPNEEVPNVPGYTPSQNTVTPIDPAKDTPVVYNPDVTPTPTPTPVTITGKQTITFVDGDNDNTPLRDPDVQTHKFTNGESSYTFGTVNVPVIDGYVSEVKTAGGKTVTPDNPDANVTVVYHKIGKIVPVDPDHNPIPGADQPQYKNDPNDPTKVIPDEEVPTIDGYTPSENTVTPVDPTKDTEIVYTKKETPKKPEPSVPSTPKKETPKPKNNKPKPAAPKPAPNYNNNIAPHSQNGYWNNNVAPHATTVNGWSNNIGPHGETVNANGDIVAPNGEIIGYVDKNGNPHYTKGAQKKLPQTGEKNSEAAAILGGLSAGLGMIGLAGIKKRREDKD